MFTARQRRQFRDVYSKLLGWIFVTKFDNPVTCVCYSLGGCSKIKAVAKESGFEAIISIK